MKKILLLIPFLFAFLMPSANADSSIETRMTWADSFSVNGKCYCSSSYDHGMGRYKSICDSLGKPPKGKRTYYNTIQCGHGPAHNDKIRINGRMIADEIVCPGKVPGKCNTSKGPKWDTSQSSGTTRRSTQRETNRAQRKAIRAQRKANRAERQRNRALRKRNQ